jgi:hypothetical protein
VVRNLSPIDVVQVEGLPVTTVARTIVDLTSLVGSARLEGALDDALRARRVSVSSMEETLVRLRTRGRRGATTLEGLLLARRDAVRPSRALSKDACCLC